MVSNINPKLIVVTTITNICLVTWLATKPVQVEGQEGIPAGAAEVHIIDRAEQECTLLDSISGACSIDYINDKPYLRDDKQEREFEEDPMLEEMTGLGFKAYKRADISSFYQESPGSRVEREPTFQGQAGKFVNLSPEHLGLYWDAGDGSSSGKFISIAGPFGSTGTATFPGHAFYFIRPKTKEVTCSFRVKKGASVYYCDPYVKNDASDPSAGVVNGPIRPSINLNDHHRELYDAAVFNREFAPLYKNFTGGSEWLANYPSKPPQHHMWRADYFGQEHTVQTAETHFIELPSKELLGSLSVAEMQRGASSPLPLSEYRIPGFTNITIKAVSVAPRIFQIENFLSDVEVDHLLDLAMKKNMIRSTTGLGGTESHVSSVRTSRTTWLPRFDSPIMNAIIRRAGDVLKIDEALLRNRLQDEMPDHPNKKPINEDLQLVHYDQGQQYTAHHDFGYPDSRPNTPSRSINLCMYLNEGIEGGETAFPRWRNAETTDAIKAVPKRGKAMIFYMKNPDGNLDDLSQHAAMPVIEGEKWFANLWTWDPVRG